MPSVLVSLPESLSPFFIHSLSNLMTDYIFNLADDNGCITWMQAVRFAWSHGILEEFFKDYEVMIGEPVDAGELLVWAGY